MLTRVISAFSGNTWRTCCIQIHALRGSGIPKLAAPLVGPFNTPICTCPYSPGRGRQKHLDRTFRAFWRAGWECSRRTPRCLACSTPIHSTGSIRIYCRTFLFAHLFGGLRWSGLTFTGATTQTRRPDGKGGTDSHRFLPLPLRFLPGLHLCQRDLCVEPRAAVTGSGGARRRTRSVPHGKPWGTRTRLPAWGTRVGTQRPRRSSAATGCRTIAGGRLAAAAGALP